MTDLELAQLEAKAEAAEAEARALRRAVDAARASLVPRRRGPRAVPGVSEIDQRRAKARLETAGVLVGGES